MLVHLLLASLALTTFTRETSILLKISYDGRRFTGWSAANDNGNVANNKRGFVRSVQGAIQRNAAKVYGNIDPQSIVVEGCSRTDRGVHATSQVVLLYALNSTTNDTSFSTTPDKRIPHPHNATDTNGFLPIPNRNIAFTLNRMLPDDIRVTAWAVPPKHVTFRPSRDTASKTYRYSICITGNNDPIRLPQQWQVKDLDISAMEKAAEIMVGTHDFTAFAGRSRSKRDRVKNKQRGTICTINYINITSTTKSTKSEQLYALPSWASQANYSDGNNNNINNVDTVTITVNGNRFLYKMVRFMVGALVEVGTSRSMEKLKRCLLWGKNETLLCAPAHGLVLQDVEYGKHDIIWHTATS